MPNWVHNTLTVYGTDNELYEFTKKITDEYQAYDLTLFKPMPEILKGTESPWADTPEPHPNWATLLANGEIDQDWHDTLCKSRRENHEAGVKAFRETGYHTWYDWCVANWGVKWPPSDVWVVKNVDSLEIKFTSPWSPPVKLIETIAQKNHHLSFVLSFTEEADQYMGAILFMDGEIKADEGYDFDDDMKFPEHFKARYIKAYGDDAWDELHEIYIDLLAECVSTVEKRLFNSK